MRYKIDQHDYDVRIGQPVLPQGGRQGEVHRDLPRPRIQHTALAETLLRRMAKDLEEKAEIQQAPKREGRNMIMFLTPRKTPLVKKEEKEQAATRPCAPSPHHPAHRSQGGQPPGLNRRIVTKQQAPCLG